MSIALISVGSITFVGACSIISPVSLWSGLFTETFSMFGGVTGLRSLSLVTGCIGSITSVVVAVCSNLAFSFATFFKLSV